MKLDSACQVVQVMLNKKEDGVGASQEEDSRPEGGNRYREDIVPPYRCQPVLMIGALSARRDYA